MSSDTVNPNSDDGSVLVSTTLASFAGHGCARRRQGPVPVGRGAQPLHASESWARPKDCVTGWLGGGQLPLCSGREQRQP
eukprot:11190583-Lingulodinium_polyedra.AAC.1